jgi:hypothetical protein
MKKIINALTRISQPKPDRKADVFLWYWKPPFNDPKSNYYFDREHWWKKSFKGMSHDAALYELIRRHPRVGEFFHYKTNDNLTPFPPVALNVVAGLFLHDNIALRPWSKLSKQEQAQFVRVVKSAYPGKGQDLTKGVFDMTGMAKNLSGVGGRSFENYIEEIAKLHASNGRLILAVDIDFGSEKKVKAALKQIASIYRKSCKKPNQLKRAHWETWCSAIEAFEREFAVEGDSKFKLGYPKKFNQFIRLFDSFKL